jgi:hypothetical protein
MSDGREQALTDARKLVRTLGSAPDARARARAVVSELRRADVWSAAELRKVDAVDAWLRTSPPVTDLQPRLRALLTAMQRQ